MQAQRRFSLTLALGAILATTAIGCNKADDKLPREPISGAITFNGAPLAEGTISFMPTAADASGEAITGSSMITDGKYSIDRVQGLIPGSYKVIISGAASGPVVKMDSGAPGEPLPAPPDPIPAKYNKQSTLTAEVKADAENTFNFDLTK